MEVFCWTKKGFFSSLIDKWKVWVHPSASIKIYNHCWRVHHLHTLLILCVYVYNRFCWTSLLLLLLLQRNSPKRDNRHENSHNTVRFWLCTKQLVLKKIIKAYVQFHELIETWYAKFQLQLNYFHCYQSTMYAMFAYTTVQTLTLGHILTFHTHSRLCTQNIFVWFNVLS